METRLIDIRSHICRKPKKCWYCEEVILQGETYKKIIAIVDSKFISTSWHPVCQKRHAGYCKDQERKQ